MNISKQLQELYKNRIEAVNNLLSTDYKAIKYAEGVISEEEYASVKLLRQSWRNQINEIDEEIKKLQQNT